MHLISMENISKSMGGRLLFDEVTLGIDSPDKIGFLGANGAGKSTLLKILSGEWEPDGGKLHPSRALKLSVLSQEVRYNPGEILWDFIFRHENPLLDLVRRYENSLDMRDPGLYQELLEEMNRRDAWALESRIKSILKRLGITGGDLPMETLSGGMKRRVGLARTLAGEANLLLLDEPTNHLDLDTILWLQDYLVKIPAALVIITHDRYFLEAVCNQIWELESAKVYRCSGDYTDYLCARAERLAARAKEQKRMAAILRREEAWLRQGPKARTSRDKKRLDNLYGLREGITSAEPEQRGFSVDPRRLGKKVLEVKNLTKTYDGRPIIRGFSYEFRRGERIGLLGANGTGKSTLLDLLAGSIEPEEGSRTEGINTHFGYFRQHYPEAQGGLEVLESLYRIAARFEGPDGAVLTPETLLDRFLFPRSLHRTPVGDLSGGEKRRFYLVSILLKAPNFLLLDEPTNDLDLMTLSLLEDFLESFTGCIVMVSHDRAFLDRLAEHLFILPGENGAVQRFGGICSDYLVWRSSQRPGDKREAASKGGREGRGGSSRGLSFKERRELEDLEGKISDLEEEQGELERFFSTASSDPGMMSEKSRRHREILALLEEHYRRWEDLEERS